MIKSLKSESMNGVFKKLPPETRVELIDNELCFMGLSPRLQHQKVLKELLFKIGGYVEKKKMGQMYFGVFNVYLDEYFNIVQPDLMFVSRERQRIVNEDGIHGSPDIIIEILSPWNDVHDLRRKRSLYEYFAVKEYFVVDPDKKKVISYQLVQNLYETGTKHTGVIVSKLLKRKFSF